MARGGADIDTDRSQYDVVGLPILELAAECGRIDRLVVVRVRVRQAGWKIPSMRDGIPLVRSSSS